MKHTWEYLIYQNRSDFENGIFTFNESYYTNKKVCIYDCKQVLKDMKCLCATVKIQSNDRESIDIYFAINKFGNVIFYQYEDKD